MESLRIALDVMGGDNAPEATLDGALRAISSERKHALEPGSLLLVGDAERIEEGLKDRGGNPGFEVLHASQVVDMHDSPAVALRSKSDSSISVAVRAVKEGKAGAVVSMGNTGALVAAATRGLGTLEGVRRPGIAVTFALGGRPLTVLDMGANIAPKPDHLSLYALMGSIYAQQCLDCKAPRVGLLNIGEEASKGTDLLKEAHQLISETPVNFVGNVEGNDMFQGKVDVIVTDGFTGNVVLKLLEGFAGFMMGLVAGELKQHGADYGRELFANVNHQIDYAEYGGALLLGVNGVVVVGHGRSDGVAVANALGLAAGDLDAGLNAGIVKGVAAAFPKK
ncbi:MAG: glycerol-3-phosphate acyltransferase PlsX [Candidatus Paceibacteria bacterium]|jgi:glycerol-3-phosphate acyltransferase PlsX